jgi:hypothetical protein
MTIGDQLRPAIIGPFGPAQLACLRSWMRLGLSPIFVQVRESERVIRPALRLGAYKSFLPADLATQSGTQELIRFLEAGKASGITCLSDEMAIWLNGLRPVMPAGTKVWLPDTPVIQFLDSKSAQTELARSVGFATLPTHFIDRAGGDLPNDVSFPMVARPDGAGTVVPSFKAEFIPNRAHLDTFLARFKLISRPIVLQPFISGPNLVIHGYRGKSGRPIGHTGFEVERKFEGVSLVIRSSELDRELRRCVEKFCDRIDIVGCYHCDLIVDQRSRRSYFLEMNGRLGGTTGKAFASGYDEPASLLVAHGILDRKVLDHPILRRRCTNKMSLAKYLIHLATGQTTPLDYPVATAWRNMFDIGLGMVSWRDEVFTARDLPSSFSYYLQVVTSKVFGRQELP